MYCVVLMQTLDGVGCSDISFSLHAANNFGICWPPILPVGQMLHCVSNFRREMREGPEKCR